MLTKLHVATLLLLPLAAGCAKTLVVHLDTGQGEPIVYTPPSKQESVKVDEDAFQEAVARMVLDMRLPLRSEDQRSPRVLRASWEPEGTATGGAYSRWCQSQESPAECLTLLGDGFIPDAKTRRKIALSFAWDSAWDGVAAAVRDTINPVALKAMITSAMASYMVLLTAPEPVTKIIAIALSAYLVAYLGTGPVWNMVKAWGRLTEESEKATSFEELEKAGRHFGKVMGDNGTRIVILVAMSALGGRAGMATQGPTLPGYAQAALAAETNAGLQLAAASTGGVHSIAIAESTLTVGLAPGAVAATAWGSGSGSGEQATNHTTTRQRGATTYRFNTGHAFNRPHKAGADLRKTSLTPDEVENAIADHLDAYRASGGNLPVANGGALPIPYRQRVTIGTYTIEFSAVMDLVNTVFIGTYYLLP